MKTIVFNEDEGDTITESKLISNDCLREQIILMLPKIEREWGTTDIFVVNKFENAGWRVESLECKDKYVGDFNDTLKEIANKNPDFKFVVFENENEFMGCILRGMQSN